MGIRPVPHWQQGCDVGRALHRPVRRHSTPSTAAKLGVRVRASTERKLCTQPRLASGIRATSPHTPLTGYGEGVGKCASLQHQDALRPAASPLLRSARASTAGAGVRTSKSSPVRNMLSTSSLMINSSKQKKMGLDRRQMLVRTLRFWYVADLRSSALACTPKPAEPCCVPVCVHGASGRRRRGVRLRRGWEGVGGKLGATTRSLGRAVQQLAVGQPVRHQ